MGRRLEKNNSGFPLVFLANLSYILSNILCKIIPIYLYSTNMWFKIAEKTDAKYIGNFLYNIIDKLLHKFAKKMQCKTCRKFPI